MRRKDKERTETEFLHGILNEAEDMCLALNTGEAPYTFFVNFIYLNGALFAHGACEGRKLDLLRADPRVGFTIATGVQVVPEKFTTNYRSLVGTGIANVIEDIEEKKAVFMGFADKYQAACPRPVPQNMADRIAVIKIAIKSLSGKQSLAKL